MLCQFPSQISNELFDLQTNNDNAAEDDRVAESSGDDHRASNSLQDHPQSFDATMLDELPRTNSPENHRQLQSWERGESSFHSFITANVSLSLLKFMKDLYQVQREIDTIIGKMSAVLPVDASVNILNPVIATGDFPNNLCALKILRDLADQQGKDFTDNHLDILMPNIARVSLLQNFNMRGYRR